MYTSICWYLRVLPVLHRPEVVDIGVKSYIEKHAICLKDYSIRSFLSIQYVHGDLCKHLGIDLSTDHRKYQQIDIYIYQCAAGISEFKSMQRINLIKFPWM